MGVIRIEGICIIAVCALQRLTLIVSGCRIDCAIPVGVIDTLPDIFIMSGSSIDCAHIKACSRNNSQTGPETNLGLTAVAALGCNKHNAVRSLRPIDGSGSSIL